MGLWDALEGARKGKHFSLLFGLDTPFSTLPTNFSHLMRKFSVLADLHSIFPHHTTQPFSAD